MFWTRAILWKIIKVLGYLIGMVRYYPARKKKFFFVPYLTRPHTLRHTFTTRLCESGINIKVIQDVLGHADISTTMNIYADVTRDLKEREFGVLNEYLQKQEIAI